MTATIERECVDAAPVLSEALLRRFDTPGPRYTSYPTADRFVEAFGAAELSHVLQQRAQEQHISLPEKSGDPCNVMRFLGRIH